MINNPDLKVSSFKVFFAWISALLLVFAISLMSHNLLINRLGCIKNYGFAFGININTMLLVLVNALILLGVIYIIFKAIRRVDNTLGVLKLSALGLVLVGGGLNLFERVQRGFVCDYINYIRFSGNIADILVVAGCLVLGAVIILDSKKV